MLTFFYSTQTCSTAIHIALEEAGLPYKGVEVSWRRKVNVAELEAVNPLGQVPVLVNEGKTLNQCIAILEYVADQVPAKKIIPAAGNWERAQAMSWLAFIGADFQKSFLPMFMASRWTADTAVQTEIKKSVKEGIQKQLNYINQSLTGKDYLLGSEYSVADMYLFTILGWCKWSEIEIGNYSNLKPYLKRIYDRPAVQKVLAKEEMLDFIPN